MWRPEIIQGGMGFAISTWQLARAVSLRGHLGVVSGVAIGGVLLGRLVDGDRGAHMRRALAHFPDQELVSFVLGDYFRPGGQKPGFRPGGQKPNEAYPRMEMWTATPSIRLQKINALGAFVEVWLAKQGHEGPVGINLLEKSQMQNLSALYGAMLAGVDYVLVGAGIPLQIPGALDQLAKHERARLRLDVAGASRAETYEIAFTPREVFPSLQQNLQQDFEQMAEGRPDLKRPFFLPIVSSLLLAKALLKRANGRIDGFIVEGPVAGGHNAPPRKPKVGAKGEPIYGERDVVDLDALAALGLPYWLAGGFGRPGGLVEAQALGAAGIQVGTLFAYCDESGMAAPIKRAVLAQIKEGDLHVQTSAFASPTGFPFKIVPLRGSLSEPAVVQARERRCDIGLLRQPYRRDDGSLGYRCAAEPAPQFIKKGGTDDASAQRLCLCNALSATAGFAQLQKTTHGDYLEPPLVTSGDGLSEILPLLAVAESYDVGDVLRYLLPHVEASATMLATCG